MLLLEQMSPCVASQLYIEQLLSEWACFHAVIALVTVVIAAGINRAAPTGALSVTCLIGRNRNCVSVSKKNKTACLH